MVVLGTIKVISLNFSRIKTKFYKLFGSEPFVILRSRRPGISVSFMSMSTFHDPLFKPSYLSP